MTDNYDLKQEALEQNDPGKRSSNFGFNYLQLPEGVKFFAPRDNEYEIVRLMTFPNEGTFSKLVQVHYNVGGNNTVLCPAMFGEHCSLCQIKSDLYAAKKNEEASAFYASRRSLVYVIDRNKESEGPKVFGFSQTAMGLLHSQIKNLKTGVVFNVGHPDKGQDIVLKKFKKGKEKYAQVHELQLDQEGITPLSRDAKQRQDWLNFIEANPISGMLKKLTDTQIVELIEKGESGETAHKQLAEAEEEPKETKTIVTGNTTWEVTEGKGAVNVTEPTPTVAETAVATATKPAVDMEAIKARCQAALKGAK
jgi:gp32 DNA binding protein like